MGDEFFYKAGSILLLSIKPQYVSMLFDGRKSTELRRVRPRVSSGDIVLIYETSPTMALVGYASVESVTTETPIKLWKNVGWRAGITKSEFDSYYKEAKYGYAINFSNIVCLRSPVALTRIKKLIDGFHPPQSYRYICPAQAISLCLT